VAGALATHAIYKIGGKDAELAHVLEDAGIMRFIMNILWPSPEADPRKLGIEQVGGVNPVEYIAEYIGAALNLTVGNGSGRADRRIAGETCRSFG
jgi:hypothetical protein